MDFDSCVEAHLTGICVMEDARRIDVSLRLPGGEHVVLKAEGVDRFVANEFREQNIVDRVNVWDEKNKSEDFRDILAELISGMHEGAIDDAFVSLIGREIDAIKKGEKILVEIEPVYGVWAVLLAEKISLET